MSSTPDSNPPPYVRIVYDETHRGKWYMQLSIQSMAHLAHILGYLEHLTPPTQTRTVPSESASRTEQESVSNVPTNHSPNSDVDTP